MAHWHGCARTWSIEEISVPEQPDKLKAQAEEYEKLADAAVDPEDKEEASRAGARGA
jgi:hypothetical protein